jgi:hypothetical protein
MRRRLIPSLEEPVPEQDQGYLVTRARTWRLAEEMTVKRSRIQSRNRAGGRGRCRRFRHGPVLKPQDIEELIEQLDDVTVDVDDLDAKVQVFCE